MPIVMNTEGVRQRILPPSPPSSVTDEKPREYADKSVCEKSRTTEEQIQHPGGAIKHGAWTQALRMLLFALYFNGCCVGIAITQVIGAPLYWYDQDWFYAWMAMTKQQFGLVVTTMTDWWAPVTMRVSGDESVRGQLRKTEDGRLECDFPERMILIANHQIYTDWVYLWWTAYTSNMHGHLYIILKESIKYIPVLGTGMMFYGFIFLSRKWAKDKERFQYRLRKLSSKHNGPLSGSQDLDPMWLLIFPEGTNLSSNGRESSKKWADKNGIADVRHLMLPRSTGLAFCTSELKNTVEWLYDCTVAYEGVPPGQYGQDLFTLRTTYFQGRQPKSVNMHWRRFSTASLPTDEKEFGDWLLARWREKDDLIEHFIQTGRFPADSDTSPNINGQKQLKGAGYIETSVRPNNPLEFLQIFVPIAALALVVNVCVKFLNMILRTLRLR